jgi:hypothetical protein
MYGGEEISIQSCGGTPEWKTPIGRPRHTWQDITVHFKETQWEGMDWIILAQDTESSGLLCTR